MIHQEGTVQAATGLKLYYQSWHPDSKPKAVVVLVHGFGDHSGRYPHLVKSLTDHEIAVYIYDQRGHGRSPGQRGHVNRWSEYWEDAHAVVQWVRTQEPGQPVFLHGHSMGALTALEYPLNYADSLNGLIVEGAPIEPAGVGTPVQIATARLLSRLWPTFSIPLFIDPNALSRDPSVGEAYRTDPLVHGKATTRWGAEGLEIVEVIKKRAHEISLPILLLHGEADSLNTANGVRKFFETLTCPDKTLHIYPDTYHELHNEINRDQILEDLAHWILQRAGKI